MLTIAELKERLIGEGFMFTGLNDFMMETMDADSAFNGDAAETAMEDGNFAFAVAEDDYERETGEKWEGWILVEYTVDPECVEENGDFGLDVTDVRWC